MKRSLFRRGRARSLSTRISELSEELQRERIESANRISTLEARMSALEDERFEVDAARSQHRDELAQLRQALAAHRAAIDLTVASVSPD